MDDIKFKKMTHKLIEGENVGCLSVVIKRRLEEIDNSTEVHKYRVALFNVEP